MCIENAILVGLCRLQLLILGMSGYSVWEGTASQSRKEELLGFVFYSLFFLASDKVVGFVVSFLVSNWIDLCRISQSFIASGVVNGQVSP